MADPGSMDNSIDCKDSHLENKIENLIPLDDVIPEV